VPAVLYRPLSHTVRVGLISLGRWGAETAPKGTLFRVSALIGPRPGIGNPIEVARDPIRAIEPIVGPRYPIVGIRDPILYPIVLIREPIPGIQNPIVGIRDPILGIRDPILGIRDPILCQENPILLLRTHQLLHLEVHNQVFLSPLTTRGRVSQPVSTGSPRGHTL